MHQVSEAVVDELTDLPNIGEKLAAELHAAGIKDAAELRRLGSVEAALRVDKGERDACRSLLYALEGAIRGVRWHSIPKEERDALCDEYGRRYETERRGSQSGGSW
jgi:DNA transformation protein